MESYILWSLSILNIQMPLRHIGGLGAIEIAVLSVPRQITNTSVLRCEMRKLPKGFSSSRAKGIRLISIISLT